MAAGSLAGDFFAAGFLAEAFFVAGFLAVDCLTAVDFVVAEDFDEVDFVFAVVVVVFFAAKAHLGTGVRAVYRRQARYRCKLNQVST
ncbi:MAG: hypothetical protein IIA44_14595, partial [Acidobacteria bacterium]|nr:hypothetical protein [Acidobacteriota bacterium]